MSLKSFVNDPVQYAAFQEQVDKWIDHNQRTMEQCTETADIYRTQGAIRILRKLKNLREIVNDGQN